MSLMCINGAKECTGCGRCEKEEIGIIYCELCGEEIKEGETFYRILGKEICQKCVEDSRETNTEDGIYW